MSHTHDIFVNGSYVTMEFEDDESQVTHHCPACEAAARELADLRARLASFASEREREGSQMQSDALRNPDNVEAKTGYVAGGVLLATARELRDLLAEGGEK